MDSLRLGRLDRMKMDLRLGAPSAVINADLPRLAQVFWNLLNHSAKYTGPGGPTTLAAERQGNEVIVTIQDTVVGIPAEALPGLFTMFSQVDPSLEDVSGMGGIWTHVPKSLDVQPGFHALFQ